MINHQTQQGVTLIELIISIIILGIIGVGMGSIFLALISRAAEPGRLTIANFLAQERMELILAQKRLKSFDTFADPCDTITCATLSDYVVSAAITDYENIDPALTTGGTTNYKLVTVTVTGTGDLGKTTLKSAVAKY